MRVSKGLEFPVVAIPVVEDLGRLEEVDRKAKADSIGEVNARRAVARVLYAATNRATQRLFVDVGLS